MRSLMVFLFSTLLLVGSVLDGRALTVALFPLADISSEYNGVDLKATNHFHELLEQEGVTLLDDLDVRRFMAQNRLRRSGCLDSFAARKMGRELHADLVLLVTLCESGGSETGRFGLLLTAFDTDTGELVWSTQESSSLFQETSLLAIGAPRDGIDLQFRIMEIVARRVALELPKLEPREVSERYPFKLADFQVSPEYVRGASPVECFLKLEALFELPEKVELLSDAGRVILIPGKVEGEYYGRWAAPVADGDYTVSLALSGSVPSNPVELQNLSHYKVINQPPELIIDLKQGHVVNDVTIFKEQLLISSRVRPTRPISRWRFTVVRPDGRVLVKDEQDGELPRDLIWRGCNSKRQHLPDGDYVLTLTIWDAANNRSQAVKKVSLQTECQPVEVKTVKKGDKNLVRLTTPESSSSLSLTWKLNLYSPEGEPLLERSGSALPVDIELSSDIKVDFLLFSIDVYDQIGNTFSLAENRLYMPEPGVQLARGEKWSEDF